MSDTLVMLGAGGHAKVCYEIAVLMKKWENIVVLDDKLENDFFKISGTINEYANYYDADFFVAIGDNKTRAEFINKIQLNSLATLIHPSAIISSSAKIDKGTVIMPGVIINASSEIGIGCIINTGSTVDHDNEISDYVHISPGTHLAGNVSIGEFCWLGIGTNVINNIRIAPDVIIGAGSLLIGDVINSGTFYGSPIN